MSQFAFDADGEDSGDDLVSKLDSMWGALKTSHSGSSRPSYAVAGTTWLDTTSSPYKWKHYDGTDDIIVGYFHYTDNLFMLDDTSPFIDAASPTKRARVDVGNVTAGQTRVISAADRDINLASLIDRFQTKSADYTVASSDNGSLISFSASGAARTATLPAAASNGKMVVGIKKSDSSANAVTIDGNASETIDGATTLVLRNQNDIVWIVCDGTNWQILLDLRKPFFQSTGQTITSAALLTLAHGLGAAPKNIFTYVKCLTIDGNWAVGDEVAINIGNNSSATSNIANGVYWDATNIYVRWSDQNPTFLLPSKTTGVAFSPTLARWEFYVRAWA